MKLIVKSLCTAFIIAVIYSVIPFQAQCENISNDVFRLHVLANSDSEYDQSIKLKVRDKVLEYSEDMFKNAASKEQAESLTAENLKNIEQTANDELKRLGCNYTAKAEIKNMYFTTREYSAYTLPSGMYDALRITLGKGEGHNWWCVMYPSICLSAASEREERAKTAYSDSEYKIVTNEQPEYKFRIVELFEQLQAIFK
jgi:stage II sporulation protein R